jgi:glutamate/tyrosine decarboxylase-like PLP-dependent enzyme
MGMLADMLASALNQGPEISMQVTYHVELQVLDWIKEMLDYPVESSGILVSGASIANLIGLTVARNSKAQIDMRERGLKENPGKMALYGSTEMHGCIQKNVELLGLGNESLRRIPVNDEFQIDIDALKKAISEDKNAGYQPFCIVGNAGTVNTGAFDDLNTLADICMEEGLWFHIDGAFGAWAVLSPKIHHLVSGMERADSLAVDLHKWISLPKGIGCALIRRKEDHRNSFSLIPDYLKVEDSDAPAALHELGFELSRTFRALKVWMSLKENGVDKYRRLIQQNVDQAQYLAELVDAAPELECLAPVSLNIVCFRYVVDGLDDEALNDINTKLFNRLMFGGKVFVSSTVIGGKFALRACFINHRTRMNDLDVLVHEVVNIGDELVKPG